MFKFFQTSSNGESVYNLVKKEKDSKEKEQDAAATPMYRSIYSAKVRKETNDNKCWQSKTLGVPHVPLETPSTFLKKQSKRPLSTRPKSVPAPITLSLEKGCQAREEQREDEMPKPEANKKKGASTIRPKTCVRPCNANRKPSIPPAHSTLQILLQENKDFVKSNASNILNNSKLAIQPKTLRFVDMSNGNTEVWYNSGLAPRYIHRTNFGKIPTYLMKRNKELYEAREALHSQQEAEKRNSGVAKLGRDEINKMISGLQENWNQVFHLYQSLPILIDTPGKIKTKSRLEGELKKLEKDIQTLQRHDFIYVANVPKSYYVPVVAKRG